MDFLIKWKIPDELHCERFGVRQFHHPDLLKSLNELAPEERLLFLIDSILFYSSTDRRSWTGSAAELERCLTGNKFYGVEARKLLGYHTSCGTYLGRLAKRYTNRVEKKRAGGERMWTLYRAHVQMSLDLNPKKEEDDKGDLF